MKTSTETGAAMFNQLYSSEGSTREALATRAAKLNQLYKAHPLIADALDLLCLNDWTTDQHKAADTLISHLIYAAERIN